MKYMRIDDKFLALKGTGKHIYGKVVAAVAFKYRWATFTAVGASLTGNFEAIVNIEPPKEPTRLYQIRWGFGTGWEVFMQHPQGMAIFGPDRAPDQGFLTADDAHHLELTEDYEMFLLHDVTPRFQWRNLVAAQRTPWVDIEGMNYQYEEITDDEVISNMKSGSIPFARIMVGALPAVQR